MTDPLLPAVVDRLRSLGAPNRATVERATVGGAAVMVELADAAAAVETEGADATEPGGAPSNRRTAGLAHRPPGPAPSTDGLDAETLLDRAASGAGEGMSGADRADRAELALAVAALNALSVPHVDWTAGDPMALLDSAVGTVATVGLFRPAFRKFDDVEVRVVERDAVGDVAAPEGVRVETYRPAEASAALDGAEVVFVTGSAFLYGGVERYLDAAPSAATVVVVGATASFLPGPLFDAGVDVVAGASVTDPDRVRAAVRAGACGTDLHDAGVRKVYAANDGSAVRGLSLRHREGEASER